MEYNVLCNAEKIRINDITCSTSHAQHHMLNITCSTSHAQHHMLIRRCTNPGTSGPCGLHCTNTPRHLTLSGLSLEVDSLGIISRRLEETRGTRDLFQDAQYTIQGGYTVQHSTGRLHSTTQYNTVQHSTGRLHSTTQYREATQYNTVQGGYTVQHSTGRLHSTTQYREATLYNTVQHSTTQYREATLYNTVQHSTGRLHSTTQYNTVQGGSRNTLPHRRSLVKFATR